MKSKFSSYVNRTNNHLLYVLAFLLALSGCQKERIDPNGSHVAPVLSAGNPFASIQVQNNMLVFTSEQHSMNVSSAVIELEGELRDYINSTYSLEDRPEDVRYKTIYDPNGLFAGVNPINGEPLPSLELTEQLKLEEDPIKYLFEEAFAYNSLRRYLVNQEYMLMEEGIFNGDGNDPDDHFIPDDHLRMMLNDKLEWQIEGAIYKFVSATTIVEIVDASAETLANLQAEFAPPVGWIMEPIHPTPGCVGGNPAYQGLTHVGLHNFMEPNIPNACLADFTSAGNPSNTREVTFTNSSGGSFISQLWTFGDGNFSTGMNPVHTYAQDGTYTVELTLYDNSNGVACDFKSRTITTAGSCTADFDFTNVDEIVSFSEYSMVDPNTYIVDYSWDFGDNSSGSTSANPTHTYASGGSYTVCLTIETDNGCIDQYCEDINVIVGCCKTNKTHKVGTSNSPIDVGSNRGYKGKLWVTSIPGYRRAGAKTKCYRLKNNGNWTSTKADYIYAGVGGLVYADDCTTTATINNGDDDNDVRSVSYSYPFGQPLRTRPGELGGSHRFDDNGVNFTTGNTMLLQSNHCN